MEDPPKVSILKTVWQRDGFGRWGIHDLKSIPLNPQKGQDSEYFQFESQMELMTNRPGGMGVHGIFSSFGPTDFLLKQSILPVVAWNDNETTIRCIGTACMVSCSGYIMTACHVLLDPAEREYGKVIKDGNTLIFGPELNMGVIIPISPAYGRRGFRFFPFESSHYWGQWKSPPLLHEKERFDILTDIAICKISEMPDGLGHQPLNLSLNRFKGGERAFAFGYAEMDDIPMELRNGIKVIKEFEQNLFVSVGLVAEVFPENHLKRDVPTPGPCFDFRARVTGKMSGGPILGADGTVVRGVISRSFSGEKHAYGAMLGPVMHLPLNDEGKTLRNMMETGNEGIARVQGEGL